MNSSISYSGNHDHSFNIKAKLAILPENLNYCNLVCHSWALQCSHILPV